MKKSLSYAALVGGLLLATGSFAQSTPAAKPKTTAPAPAPAKTEQYQQPVHHEWASLQMDRMTSNLKLNAEQVAKLKTINGRYDQRFAEHQKQVAEHPKEEHQRMTTALMNERNMELKGVLTSDQYAQWTKEEQQSHAIKSPPAAPAPAKAPAKAPQKEPMK